MGSVLDQGQNRTPSMELVAMATEMRTGGVQKPGVADSDPKSG